ncbi:MAG TPA: apolipoprotein N-acyltransferase [Deltaproteobacteria bacterium]|jgi:apolipoprotein N-acyltransferase|nr:apolipoprotein N-acyltransferase [Deltaproteobacteria bacterium]
MTRGRAGWLAGYLVSSFLAFPHPLGGRVIDLGFVLAWVAPACLVAGLRGLGPASAARWGFLASLIAHAAILHWIYVVTVVYGEAPVLVGVLAPIALAAYIALFGAAFGAGMGLLELRGRAGPFALAALWTALDYLRHHLLSGFPWAVLGYAQHQDPALMALAPIAGVFGLSFVTVLGSLGVGASVAAMRKGRRPSLESLAACAAALAALASGAVISAQPTPPSDEKIRVAVLQGNIDQGVKWSHAWQEVTLQIYEALTRRARAEGAEVVVWPETAVPGSLETDPDFRARIEGLAREQALALVIGAVGVEPVGRDYRYYDSAYVFNSAGQEIERYDKAHLVPFGEYVPLRGLLGLLIGAVARGIAPDNVTAGSGPRAVGLPPPTPNGESSALDAPAPVPVGIPICYELLFPDLVRRFVASGGSMLLAITNDAWYGRTGAPYQFLAITALRSAETRVWTARAANTGVSAFIDDRGRVRSQTRIFERGLLVDDIPLRPGAAADSFYVRHGDVFAWACCGAAGAALVLRRRSEGEAKA